MTSQLPPPSGSLPLVDKHRRLVVYDSEKTGPTEAPKPTDQASGMRPILRMPPKYTDWARMPNGYPDIKICILCIVQKLVLFS